MTHQLRKQNHCPTGGSTVHTINIEIRATGPVSPEIPTSVFVISLHFRPQASERFGFEVLHECYLGFLRLYICNCHIKTYWKVTGHCKRGLGKDFTLPPPPTEICLWLCFTPFALKFWSNLFCKGWGDVTRSLAGITHEPRDCSMPHLDSHRATIKLLKPHQNSTWKSHDSQSSSAC